MVTRITLKIASISLNIPKEILSASLLSDKGKEAPIEIVNELENDFGE